jgi:hypothetical protein
MDFFYFLVTGSKAWEPHYHQNFFITQGGFLLGVIGALIIGAVFALAFYFGCCNSKKSSKSANLSVWALFLLLGAVVSYFYADLVVIGDTATTDKNSVFRTHSFYEANNQYYLQKTNQSGVSKTLMEDLTNKRNEIKSNLDKGGDVRFDYDITTAVLAILFFFIVSVIVKRFTINGKTIPFLKP